MTILTHEEVKQKIIRLAYQMLEEYSDEAEIFVFGINNNGTLLKEKLLNELKKSTHLLSFIVIRYHSTLLIPLIIKLKPTYH